MLATLIAAFAFGGPVGAAQRDSAVIVDSGSTNTQGYKIQVWSDNTASITMQSRAGAAESTPKAFNVPAETAAKLFADLAAARKARVTSGPCMKSASFGTTTHVTWQDWVSPDLDCPPNDALTAALVKDVEAIRQASGLNSLPIRRPPLAMPASPPKEPNR
ncbi:MAG: hypothetical protein WA814_02330 [Candidatus Baltobacteraceae bacterium]